MKLVGYVRVSRVGGREGDGYISPTVQREAIEAYAGEIGGRIVHWADDQDYSGGTAERPAFQDALERIRNGEADGIVVMKIDRFARSVADGAKIVRELVDSDKVFASCHERIDPRTPEGRFMLTSFLANAELFLDQAKASWETAKARAIARGVHIGATPIGYVRKKSQPLEVDPVAGPAMTELFRRAATGKHGPTELGRFIDERVPPDGYPQRSPSVVKRWLSSRIYLGEIRYGDLVNTEAHPPLTDERTWLACQSEPGQRFQPPEAFLLSGMIRCAFCRYAMGGNTRGGANRSTPIYRCTHRCLEPCVIVAERVEAYVRGMVEAEQEIRRLSIGTVEGGDDLVALETAHEAAEAEVQAFLGDLHARKILGEAEWRVALDARVAARDEAREALDAARRRHQLVAVASIEDLTRHQLRHLLRSMIRAVYVRRGRVPVEQRVLIEWSDDPDPLALPSPHRGGLFEPVTW